MAYNPKAGEATVSCTRCGKRIAQSRKRTHEAECKMSVIAKEYADDDGYWIELKDGWQNGTDPGTHALHEDTKREARARLDSVIPCSCDECLQRLAAAKEKK